MEAPYRYFYAAWKLIGAVAPKVRVSLHSPNLNILDPVLQSFQRWPRPCIEAAKLLIELGKNCRHFTFSPLRHAFTLMIVPSISSAALITFADIFT